MRIARNVMFVCLLATVVFSIQAKVLAEPAGQDWICYYYDCTDSNVAWLPAGNDPFGTLDSWDVTVEDWDSDLCQDQDHEWFLSDVCYQCGLDCSGYLKTVLDCNTSGCYGECACH